MSRKKRKPIPRKAMKRVGRDASAHEQLIQKAGAVHEERKAASRSASARKGAASRHKDPDGSFKRLKSIKPDRRVWETACRLADGDVSRLIVERDNLDRWGNPSVLVTNPKDKS